MRNYIIGLVGITSISTYAVLPSESTDKFRIDNRERVTTILNEKHLELKDPDCLYSPLESKRVKILVSQGYFINEIVWKMRFGMQFEASIKGITMQGDLITFYSVKCPLKVGVNK